MGFFASRAKLPVTSSKSCAGPMPVFIDGGDRVIETEVQRAAERFGSGGHGAGAD
jgi:hypothetical protein